MANPNHTTKVEVKAISSSLILRKPSAPSPAVHAQCRLFNIINESGKILWHHCTLDDAHRLIDMNTRDSVAYPDWQGDLRVKAVLDGARLSGCTLGACLTYADGLPLASGDAVEQLMRMTGHTIDRNEEYPDVSVICGEWSCEISLELALANIDRFVEPGRSRLAQLAGLYYGVQLVRGAA